MVLVGWFSGSACDPRAGEKQGGACVCSAEPDGVETRRRENCGVLALAVGLWAAASTPFPNPETKGSDDRLPKAIK